MNLLYKIISFSFVFLILTGAQAVFALGTGGDDGPPINYGPPPVVTNPDPGGSEEVPDMFPDLNTTPDPDTTDGGNPAPDPDTTAGGSQTLQNPIKSQTILEFIGKVIDVLLIFAVPIIILFIMYAGFLFVTAVGNETKLSKAKSVLLWAIVGGVIALGAKLIIEVIEGTIKAF